LHGFPSSSGIYAVIFIPPCRSWFPGGQAGVAYDGYPRGYSMPLRIWLAAMSTTSSGSGSGRCFDSSSRISSGWKPSRMLIGDYIRAGAGPTIRRASTARCATETGDRRASLRPGDAHRRLHPARGLISRVKSRLLRRVARPEIHGEPEPAREVGGDDDRHA